MNSLDYLISFFPENYQEMIINCDGKLLGQIMADEVEDRRLAYYLSMIANLKDTPAYHDLAGVIYHFHFNWTKEAYPTAFFHYWRALELQNFSDYRSLNEFISISKEPDFDIIPQENLDFVKNKIEELKEKRNETIRKSRISAEWSDKKE